VDRAWSVLNVKAADTAGRRISGIASTPEVDRQGDILELAGVTFKNPVPLLAHHDQTNPIGRAWLTATPTGITFDAELATVDEPGPFKTLADDVWQRLKAGVMSGASIGFRIVDNAVEHLRSGGRRILKSEICELSLVSVPANQNATIRLIKSLALERRGPAMTASERITALETRLEALSALMSTLLEDTPEGEAMPADKAAQYDAAKSEAKSLEADVERWKGAELLQRKSAAPILATPRHPFISVKSNLEPGMLFTRFCIAKMAARLDGTNAADYAAARWGADANPVVLALKAAVASGSTTDAVFAKPLVNNAIAADLIPLLRAGTIIGNIPNLRKVPFNVNVPAQTGGGSINWVGEGMAKPVTAMAFATESIGFAKVAAIVVLDQELVRFSNPDAEDVVRKSLVADIAAFLDKQFTDPAVAAVTAVNPASITNGAPSAAATASPLADMIGLINHFASFNISVKGLAFIMSPANALALSFRTYSDGSPQFPGIGVDGGTWKGLNVIVSSAVTTNVIALQPQLILYADDGGVTIDASTEASIQMDSAPVTPPIDTTVLRSMFQENKVAIRAERYSTWKRVGTNSVKYLTAAAWAAPTGLVLAGQAAPDDDTPATRKK